MAEMNAWVSKKYRLKKIHDYWILENTYTRKTKRVPFLSRKIQIKLEDNYIFADGSAYEIIETDSGDTRIEKINDLVYSSEQTVDEISTANRDVNIRSHQTGSVDVVPGSSFDGPYLHTNDRGEHSREQPQANKTFEVTLDDTELSKLCGLREKMILRVNEAGVSFYGTECKSATYSFSNRWIRRYGKLGTNKFCFEVGRRCPAGEGKIVGAINDSANLVKFIGSIWKNDDTR